MFWGWIFPHDSQLIETVSVYIYYILLHCIPTVMNVFAAGMGGCINWPLHTAPCSGTAISKMTVFKSMTKKNLMNLPLTLNTLSHNTSSHPGERVIDTDNNWFVYLQGKRCLDFWGKTLINVIERWSFFCFLLFFLKTAII